MKGNRLSIVALVLFTASTVYSQNSKVVSAFTYLNNGDIINAKSAIDEASVNEKSSTKSNTWYYKGRIYHVISDSCVAFNKAKYCNLAKDPLLITLDAYLKTLVLNFKDTTNRLLKIKENPRDLDKLRSLLADSKTKYFSREYTTYIIEDYFPYLEK